MLDRAVGAMPIYRVGLRFDGTPALSYAGGTPEMDTEVWFADDPDTKMTAFEASDSTDVSWFATPTEWTEPKVAAVAPPEEREGYEDLGLGAPPVERDADLMPVEEAPPVAEAPVEEQVDELSEAELDEMSEAVELAEQRVGELEALVASVILAQVKDDIFVDDEAVVASTPLAVTAAQRVGVAEGFAVVGEFLAVTAALAAAGGLPEDLATRLDAVTERLDALEDSVGKLMLDDVTDEELPEAPEGASTFVDETLDPDEDASAAGDSEEGDEEPEEDPSTDEDEEEDSDEGDSQRYPRKKKKRMKKAPPFKAKG